MRLSIIVEAQTNAVRGAVYVKVHGQFLVGILCKKLSAEKIVLMKISEKYEAVKEGMRSWMCCISLVIYLPTIPATASVWTGCTANSIPETQGVKNRRRCGVNTRTHRVKAAVAAACNKVLNTWKPRAAS